MIFLGLRDREVAPETEQRPDEEGINDGQDTRDQNSSGPFDFGFDPDVDFDPYGSNEADGNPVADSQANQESQRNETQERRTQLPADAEPNQEGSNSTSWRSRRPSVSAIGNRVNCPYCFNRVRRQDFKTLEKSGITLMHCNNCLRELPHDIFQLELVTIALVGRMSSGKTCYSTTMLRELLFASPYMHQQGYIVDFEDQRSEDKYNDLANNLYNRRKLFIEGTHADEGKEPFVLRIANGRRSPNPFKRKRRQLLISLFDIPGEEFQDKQRLHEEWPHLREADAILFMLDPMNLPNVHRELKELEPDQLDDIDLLAHFREATILSNVVKVFCEGRTTKDSKTVNKPLAMCLSKTDVLDRVGLGFFAPDSDIDATVYRAKGHLLREIRQQSDDVEEFLEEYAPEILGKTKFHFPKNMLFPVSPLGETEIKGMGLEGEPQPQGVLQPIFWILNQLKYMPL